MPTYPDIPERLRTQKICVLIPTYNNAGTVLSVVRQVRDYCHDVIVVNDGSTDQTTSILQQAEADGLISLVSYATNRGKGYALRRGFEYAQQYGFDFVISLDADGQHYATDILKLVDAHTQHLDALLIGSRNLVGVDRSQGSNFANKFSNFWFAIQTWQALPDTQTGYRLYPLKSLSMLSLLTARYEAELELLVFAAWNDVQIVPVDIEVYYPPRAERVSHFRPFADFARISVLNTILCLMAVVYGWPRLLWFRLRKYFSAT